MIFTIFIMNFQWDESINNKINRPSNGGKGAHLSGEQALQTTTLWNILADSLVITRISNRLLIVKPLTYRKPWSLLLALIICGAIAFEIVYSGIGQNRELPGLSDATPNLAGEPFQDTTFPNIFQNTDTTQNRFTGHPVAAPDVTPPVIWGILNPRQVTQTATYTTNWDELRTDITSSPSGNLFLDQAHNWMGNKVDLTINNLQRLYVKNGTFSTGINGTNVNGVGSAYPLGWRDASNREGNLAMTQRSIFLNTSGYVMVENQGEDDGDEFRHKKNAYILWNQSVTLEPYTSSFFLRFNYRYDSGPLLAKYDNRIFLNVFFDNDGDVRWDERVYDGIDLTLVGERGQWFDSGLLGINKTMPTTFNFAIGLFFRDDANLKKVDFSDLQHAEYIRLSLDNVSLVGFQKPYPSEVELQAKLPNCAWADITNISQGRGATSVSYTYWQTNPLSVDFNSNSTVSFQCTAKLYALNLRNSSWENNVVSEGVNYQAESGHSVNLTFWTIVSYPGSYQNFQFNVTFPNDWENVTVFDSFPSNVTSQCSIGIGYLQVSGSIAEQLGWWRIEFQAPNYQKSLASQERNPLGLPQWTNQSNFRCVNETRVVGSIGTPDQIPTPLEGIMVRWVLPDQTEWSVDTISGVNGEFNSTSRWLGKTNTTAGLWLVIISWQNGSEVAFGSIEFALYHATTLTAVFSTIETEPGLEITGMVFYNDADNNLSLLEDTATVVANWSSTAISFTPNPVHQRWEGSFDTNLVGSGIYTIRVNATKLYFDNTSCYFTIQVIYNTRLTSPNAPWDSVGWGTTKRLVLYFELYNWSTESWQGIENSTPYVTIRCNWTLGYWSIGESGFDGVFYLDIDTTAHLPGTWLLNITIAKTGHTNRQLLITLFVGELLTTLFVQGDNSAEIRIDESYDLTLRYEDSENNGIEGATLTVTEISPATGLSYSAFTEVALEPGNYSLTLTPLIPDVFVIRISASKFGFDNASTIFILGIREVSTKLQILEITSEHVDLGTPVTVKVRYEDDQYSGIVDANVSVALTNPADGIFWTVGTPVAGEPGNYSLTLIPFKTGYYLVVFNATKQYHETSVDSFFLLVDAYSSQLEIIGSASISVPVYNETTVTLYFSNASSGLAGANLSILHQTPATGILSSPIQDLGNGFYSITFTPTEITSFSIVFQANYSNHEPAITYLSLTAISIPTNLISPLIPPTQMIYGHNITLYLYYYCSSGGIGNASITIQGLTDDQWNYFDYWNGSYAIVLVPSDLGSYSLKITIAKSTYQNQVMDYYKFHPLEVMKIPVTITWAHGIPSAIEGEPLRLSINLLDAETNVPITIAEVRYYLTGPEAIEGILTNLGNGTYSSVITLTSFGTYTIMLTTQLSQFYEVQPFEATISVTPNTPLRIMQSIGITLIILLILTTTYLSVRQIRKRRRSKRIQLLAVRQEFLDAQNILAVLILHKESGLPFFSLQIRQETPSELIAGFITAISHFRREVLLKSKEELLTVIPISDVVNICSTSHTLCALVTLIPPSQRLRDLLVDFSHQIEQEFDALINQLISKAMKLVVPQTLQELVEITFGLRLTTYFKENFGDSPPKRYRNLAQICQTLEGEPRISLIELARNLMDQQNSSEEEAYFLIKQALKECYLISIPRDPALPRSPEEAKVDTT